MTVLRACFFLLVLVATTTCGFAGVITFSNTGTITIPSSGAATPYPSTISVSGAGVIDQVTVTLFGLYHTWPDDIDILLVGPTGATVMLMSEVGGSSDIVGADLTFSDSAGESLPDSTQIIAGTYRPTDSGTGDSFVAPAPEGPWGATLSVFNGTDSTGTWALYVVDDTGGDLGSIAGGWSLTITSPDSAVPEPATFALIGAGLLGLALIGRRCISRR